MKIDSIINIIAPTLRILIGNKGRYPAIRFQEKPKEQPGNFISISISQQQTQEQVIETLSRAVSQSAQPVEDVYVEGLGLFSVIASKVKASARATGKIAIITGAAQGFGFKIAQDMASQGAITALADINETAVKQAAESIRKEFGQQIAIPLTMDVTEPGSVQKAVHVVVRTYGGLDILVSNAGVLKAESVKTQSVKDFDFVADVNYKGYFVCTQAVADILAIQHKVDPEYTSDIIQINSKSGLEGSNRNAAYAGSKFGGIGLTQSFALELIKDGIKVNSICPGNFFDGPLWSDPETGLFVEYLRSGKVAGAKTIEDVRKAYEDKVPMHRGCTTADVMAAIYYLIEQQYETGQALPVTGGQIMLH